MMQMSSRMSRHDDVPVQLSDVYSDVGLSSRQQAARPTVRMEEHLAPCFVSAHYEATKGDDRTAWDRFRNLYQHRYNGLVLDKTPGLVEETRGKLLGYDPASLQYRLGLCPAFNARATIMSSFRYLFSSIAVAVATFLTTIFWESGSAYIVAKEVLDSTSALLLQLSSFVIAGFVSLVVTRWYQRRLYYIALIGNLKATLVLAAGFVVAPASGSSDAQATAAAARATIGRYCRLCMELAWLKGRSTSEAPASRAYLFSKGLLTSDAEWHLMVPGARQLSVLAWLGQVLNQCAHAGCLERTVLVQFCSLIERARSNSSDMMDRTILDIPFAYAHIVTLLVKMAILFNTVRVGAIFGIEYRNEDGSLPGTGPLILGILSSVAANVGLQGLLDIQTKLHNPFGDSEGDIPHEKLMASLDELAEGLARNLAAADLGVDGAWTARPQKHTGAGASRAVA